MVTDDNLTHPEKALFPIFFNPVPIVTVVSFLQPLNAKFPMDVTLLGIFIFVNAVQFLNAPVPIDVTFEPRVTVFNFVQP